MSRQSRLMDKNLIKMPHVVWDRSGGLLEVTQKSPKEYRLAAEEIARYFLRETGCMSLQYSAYDDEATVYLFLDGYLESKPNGESVRRTLGAICFRERRYQDHENNWELDWVWLHPFERNKGLLQRYWKKFLKKFGPFLISEPISRSMKGFLEKIDYPTTKGDFFQKKKDLQDMVDRWEDICTEII